MTMLSTACQKDDVYFTDNIDLEFNWHPLRWTERPDKLHQPYVLGSSFYITVHRDHEDMDISNIHVVSTDPSVLHIEAHEADEKRVTVYCTAVGVGKSRLIAYKSENSTKEWDSVNVFVEKPDDIQLHFSGAVLLDLPWSEEEVSGHLKVLTGGTATFLVRYYKGDTRLYGHGALSSSDAGDQVSVVPDTTYLFEDREWVRLTPHQDGQHKVGLYIGDDLIKQLDVYATSPAEVAYIRLEAESDKGADDEDTLGVLAIGYNSHDERIFGMEFTWKVYSREESGEGDLYKYHFSEDCETQLTAVFEGYEDQVTVYMKDGWVSSSNNLGCSLTGFSDAGPSSAAAAFTFLLIMIFLALRRRYRVKPPGSSIKLTATSPSLL